MSYKTNPKVLRLQLATYWVNLDKVFYNTWDLNWLLDLKLQQYFEVISIGFFKKPSQKEYVSSLYKMSEYVPGLCQIIKSSTICYLKISYYLSISKKVLLKLKQYYSMLFRIQLYLKKVLKFKHIRIFLLNHYLLILKLQYFQWQLPRLAQNINFYLFKRWSFQVKYAISDYFLNWNKFEILLNFKYLYKLLFLYLKLRRKVKKFKSIKSSLKFFNIFFCVFNFVPVDCLLLTKALANELNVLQTYQVRFLRFVKFLLSEVYFFFNDLKINIFFCIFFQVVGRLLIGRRNVKKKIKFLHLCGSWKKSFLSVTVDFGSAVAFGKLGTISIALEVRRKKYSKIPLNVKVKLRLMYYCLQIECVLIKKESKKMFYSNLKRQKFNINYAKFKVFSLVNTTKILSNGLISFFIKRFFFIKLKQYLKLYFFKLSLINSKVKETFIFSDFKSLYKKRRYKSFNFFFFKFNVFRAWVKLKKKKKNLFVGRDFSIKFFFFNKLLFKTKLIKKFYYFFSRKLLKKKRFLVKLTKFNFNVVFYFIWTFFITLRCKSLCFLNQALSINFFKYFFVLKWIFVYRFFFMTVKMTEFNLQKNNSLYLFKLNFFLYL